MMAHWQDICAQRMARTLNSKPRSGKTRAYLATLPKRGPVAVSPDEFQPIPSRAEARASKPKQAIRDARRYAAWEQRGKPPSPGLPPRKDRQRPSARRASLSPLLAKIADYQGLRCVLCGEEMLFATEPNDALRASLDHVLPRSRGGKDKGNLLAAHIRCNQRKGNALPSGCELVWLAFVNARLEAQDAGNA